MHWGGQPGSRCLADAAPREARDAWLIVGQWFTRQDVASASYSFKGVRKLVSSKPPEHRLTSYRRVRLAKGGGKFREIYIPAANDRMRLRSLLPGLENILSSVDDAHVNYAFEKAKNCALNAFQHIGYQYTLSFDLKDFFDNVSAAHVAGIVPDVIVQSCFIDGAPRQGLPTSPLIATIAFLKADRKIIDLMKKTGVRAVYTRYADDLAFSFDDPKAAGKIKVIVEQVVAQFGFQINARKTCLQDARNGRRIITGIAVDHDGLHATRKVRRKIRAAKHQQNERSARGLEEWAKCKLPKCL